MKMTLQKIIKNLKDPYHSPILRRWTIGWFARSIKNYCPVCCKASHFLSAGNPQRQNVQCPSCLSLERHRFIWLCLENYLIKNNISKQEKAGGDRENLLHFAPEPCLKNKFEQLFATNYMTGDISPGRAKKVVDITNICFSDESYDCIICNHVLEHIPNDKLALSELYRVLKKGGTAFLSVPLKGEKTDEDLSITAPDERTKRFGQFDHVRYYGMDFKGRIENAGFSVTVIYPNDIIDNENIRNVLGINCTEGLAGNILFLAAKQ